METAPFAEAYDSFDPVDRAMREQFARLMALGMTPMQSLRGAGFSQSAHILASIMFDPEVRASIRRYRAQLNDMQEIPNARDVVGMAMQDRDFAYSGDAPAAALGATALIAKIAGVTELDETSRRQNTIEFVPLRERIERERIGSANPTGPVIDMAG